MSKLLVSVKLDKSDIELIRRQRETNPQFNFSNFVRENLRKEYSSQGLEGSN